MTGIKRKVQYLKDMISNNLLSEQQKNDWRTYNDRAK